MHFRAESVDWPLSTYVDYMRNNSDESPLYLFDKDFFRKMSLRPDSYTAPSCFGTDLFAVLGEKRPDHAWLIIGPERGGSTFHKDPNSTSAWNAVVRGAKYWIMFPPNTTPPGVFVSQDQSEVTSPLSIMEWLLIFHGEARTTLGCMEGICGEGEVLHVPSGWWHLVINLQETIAVTQNFVPRNHVVKVLDFLRNQPEQVSGFPKEVDSPYKLFKHNVALIHPEILEESLENSTILGRRTKRKWDELVEGEHFAYSDIHENFNFGFSYGIDEEIP